MPCRRYTVCFVGIRSKAKKYSEAIADLNKAIEIDGEFTAALFDGGELYLKAGENEKALLDFNQVISNNDDANLTDVQKNI